MPIAAKASIVASTSASPSSNRVPFQSQTMCSISIRLPPAPLRPMLFMICHHVTVRQGQARATAANRERYAGDEVAGYQRDPYHRRRIELAVGLLATGLTAQSVVADLGAG